MGSKWWTQLSYSKVCAHWVPWMLTGADKAAVKVTASCCKLSWRIKLGPTRIHPNPSTN